MANLTGLVSRFLRSACLACPTPTQLWGYRELLLWQALMYVLSIRSQVFMYVHQELCLHSHLLVQYRYHNNINYSNLLVCEVFLFLCIVFSFFYQCSVLLLLLKSSALQLNLFTDVLFNYFKNWKWDCFLDLQFSCVSILKFWHIKK